MMNFAAIVEGDEHEDRAVSTKKPRFVHVICPSDEWEPDALAADLIAAWFEKKPQRGKKAPGTLSSQVRSQ